MDRELLREQCEAYVLGMLDSGERTELQTLIDRADPECLKALREANDLLAQLAFSAPLQEPPALLRSRLLHSIRAESGPAAPVVTMPARRSSWIAWAVAAAMLAFAFLGHFQAHKFEGQLASARKQIDGLTQEAEQNKRVIRVLMARDGHVIRLTTTAPEAPQLRAYWSGSEGLILTGSNIPKPAAGRTMQLWVVPKGGKSPISAGVFQPDANGQVVLIASNVQAQPADAAALAISDEPAGGSPQPTTTPAWVGQLAD